MATYLLTWNPKRYDWNDLGALILKVGRGERCRMSNTSARMSV